MRLKDGLRRGTNCNSHSTIHAKRRQKRVQVPRQSERNRLRVLEQAVRAIVGVEVRLQHRSTASRKEKARRRAVSNLQEMTSYRAERVVCQKGSLEAPEMIARWQCLVHVLAQQIFADYFARILIRVTARVVALSISLHVICILHSRA